MAEAFGYPTIGARIHRRALAGRGLVFADMDQALLAPTTHHQFVFGEDCRKQDALFGTEAEINVVPEDGGIAALLCGRTRHDRSVRMALDDFKSALERQIVERVGKLAQTSADAGNQ